MYSYTPEELAEELAHLRGLLRRWNSNLHITEQQIASFAPNLVPLHLLNQRESIEEERTRVLRRMRELEECKAQQPWAREPGVKVSLLLKSLPTAVMHLYAHDSVSLLRYEISNPLAVPVSVVIASWIEQFSYTRSDTVRLDPGQTQVLGQSPILRLDQIADIYEVRDAALHTRASYLRDGQESLLFVQDFATQFLARDVLVLAVKEATGELRDLSHQLAAWVTPNERAVVEMLRLAAEYSSNGQIWGYQGAVTAEAGAGIVRDQVRAMHQALKERGQIRYINSPIGFGAEAAEIPQRVSLPKDSLQYRQANCVDGAVLYASLIERTGMHPVIAIVPGHAFVGWETWPGSGQYEFLETTMTATDPFDAALTEGRREYEQAAPRIGRPLFDPVGFTVLLDIAALRAQGILPFS